MICVESRMGDRLLSPSINTPQRNCTPYAWISGQLILAVGNASICSLSQQLKLSPRRLNSRAVPYTSIIEIGNSIAAQTRDSIRVTKLVGDLLVKVHKCSTQKIRAQK
jgi:hypothetical protein